MNNLESRAGAALPIVLAILVTLVPAVLVFSNLAHTEIVRTQRGQSGLVAQSLAEEAVEMAREGVQSGAAPLVSSGARGQGRFEAYLYELPDGQPDRRIYYSLSRGVAGDVVKVVLATLEAVGPPRTAGGIVIPHDFLVFHTDRDISSAEAAGAVAAERAPMLSAWVDRLTREQAMSDAAFQTRLGTMRGYLDSQELLDRWNEFETAMLAGRSQAP